MPTRSQGVPADALSLPRVLRLPASSPMATIMRVRLWIDQRFMPKPARLLNLAPSQHTEEALKRVPAGCHTVVETL